MIVVAIFTLSGCSTPPYYRRPYASAEAARFEVPIPTSKEITEFADGINELSTNVGMEATWDAVLKASFWGGNVIHASEETSWNRRLLVSFHVLEYFKDPPFYAITAESRKFMGESWVTPNETWFAIDVTSTNASSTHITVTWINPETMQPDDPHTLAVSDEPSVLMRLTAERAREDFLSAVSLQLDTTRWAELFNVELPSDTYSSKLDLTRATRPEWSIYATSIGSVHSTMYRRHHFVVIGHPIEDHMNSILARLCDVAGCTTEITARAFLVANRSESARSFPNGDIYIGKTLLDRLQSNDELAAVLAHELDHIVQYDSIARLETQKLRNAKFVQTYLGLGYAIAAGLTIYITASLPEKEPLTKLVVPVLMGLAGLSMYAYADTAERSLSKFSADTEFRADANAAILLRRAGFDPAAMMHVLRRERAWYE